jgi:hypothetical protein
LCGELWFSAREGVYRRTDKYVGRRMSAAGFEQALLSFCSDGRRLRLGVVNHILGQLHKLKRTVRMLPSYRFYSR